MSGVRGQYPQIFLADSKGTPQFYVGGYDALVSVNDANGISDTVRGANPELVTWETLMNLDLDFDLGDRGGAASSRSPRNGNDPGSPQSCCVIVNGSRAQ